MQRDVQCAEQGERVTVWLAVREGFPEDVIVSFRHPCSWQQVIMQGTQAANVKTRFEITVEQPFPIRNKDLLQVLFRSPFPGIGSARTARNKKSRME